MQLTRKQYRALELLAMAGPTGIPAATGKEVWKDLTDTCLQLDEMELIIRDKKGFYACRESFDALLEERPDA